MCRILVAVISFVYFFVQITCKEICQSSSGEFGICSPLTECSKNYTTTDFCASSDNNRVCCIEKQINLNANTTVEIIQSRIKRSANLNDTNRMCTTPNGENGLCVKRTRCSTFNSGDFTMSKSILFQQSICLQQKKNINKVCCSRKSVLPVSSKKTSTSIKSDCPATTGEPSSCVATRQCIPFNKTNLSRADRGAIYSRGCKKNGNDGICCAESQIIKQDSLPRRLNPMETFNGNCRNSVGSEGSCVRFSQCSTTRNKKLDRTQYLHRRVNLCPGNSTHICCPKNNIISSGSGMNNINTNKSKNGKSTLSCQSQNGICKSMEKCSQNQILRNVSNCQRRQVCCLNPSPIEKTVVKNKLELLPKDCGTGGAYQRPSIYNGEETDINEYGWMALLAKIMPGNSEKLLEYRCGGFLISERYVVTAAHCVHGIDYQFYSIRLGEWDYNARVDCYKGICSADPIDFGIQQIKIHPYYTTNSIINDIALIRLNQTVVFSSFIQPICLPIAEYLRNEIYDGTLLEVSGWGKTQHTEVSTRKLKASVSGMTNQNCGKLYKGQIFSWGQMCASGSDNRGSCRGDSGGPLMYLDLNATFPHWVAVGIAAAGPEECGIGNQPSIYTRVATQLDWILDNLQV